MDILIGTIISALATGFVLSVLDATLPAGFFRYVKLIGTYPMNLIAFWYLDLKGFPVFVGAAAASLLALLLTLVVERLS
jgi:hypothetical protein